MKRRQLIVLAAVLIGLTVLSVLDPWEPRYEGRKLSEWLADGGHGIECDKPTRLAALRTYHEQSVARLVGRLRSQPWSGWSALEKRFPDVSEFRHRSLLRHWAEIHDLMLLGSLASNAIPELERTMLFDSHPWNRIEAEAALAVICHKPLASYFSALTNARNAEVFENAARLVGGLGTNGAPAIPALVGSLTNQFPGWPDSEWKAEAIDALGRIAREPDICIPEIVPFLAPTNCYSLRINAAFALGRFPKRADSESALKAALTDADTWVQRTAQSTLNELERKKRSSSP